MYIRQERIPKAPGPAASPTQLQILSVTSTSASSIAELKDTTSSLSHSGRPDSLQPKKSRRSAFNGKGSMQWPMDCVKGLCEG